MDARRAPPRGTEPLGRPLGAGGARDALAHALADDLDAAFERFVDRYQNRLFAFVLTLVHNRSEAEEIAQDAFVSAYRALQKYDAEKRRTLALRAWLFTIALNKVRNLARRPATVELDDTVELRAPTREEPASQAEANDAVAIVRRALDELAPRYRMPVVLRHLQGLTYDEIADVLGQPVGTAKANVHRGLAQLRGSRQIGALVPC